MDNFRKPIVVDRGFLQRLIEADRAGRTYRQERRREQGARSGERRQTRGEPLDGVGQGDDSLEFDIQRTAMDEGRRVGDRNRQVVNQAKLAGEQRLPQSERDEPAPRNLIPGRRVGLAAANGPPQCALKFVVQHCVQSSRPFEGKCRNVGIWKCLLDAETLDFRFPGGFGRIAHHRCRSG
ncbi:MAG: hypothetical protein H6Q05_4449 [Acidobacteria bacterium]|nr:hypothetical protein [Acidobacteriota bacterium]